MLAAHQSWAGPASYASQRCLGTTRRPTAAAFRLYKLQTPFLGVTQQGSAPTQTQSDLNAVEEAMRVSKMGNGAVPGVRPAADSNKNPAQQVVESSLALKREFDKVKEEVSKYTKLCEENQQQQKEIERLQQDTAALDADKARLVFQLAELEQSQRAILEGKDLELMQQAEEQSAQASLLVADRDKLASLLISRQEELARLQDELSRLVAERDELTLEAERRQEELTLLLAQREVDLQLAMESGRQEATGPLQQQLDELAMQQLNSQVQLERLGEALEEAQAEKAVVLQALGDENKQLLLALEGATRRLVEVVYPPGSLPPGINVTTRLEGGVDLQAVAAAQAAKLVTSQAAVDPVAVVESPAGGEDSSNTNTSHQASGSPQLENKARKSRGFGGWLFGVLRFWLYQGLGALLLYYTASILRGVPPEINMAFCAGCLAVCTLLSWMNRLLIPPIVSV